MRGVGPSPSASLALRSARSREAVDYGAESDVLGVFTRRAGVFLVTVTLLLSFGVLSKVRVLPGSRSGDTGRSSSGSWLVPAGAGGIL